MHIKKRLLAFLFAAALACAASASASALELPDLSRSGSITVTMHQGDCAIPGGSLSLFCVGDVLLEDGNFSFTLSQDFLDCGLSLDDIDSSDLAASLAQFADDAGLSGTTVQVDSSGVALFSDLQAGLYLIVQSQAADGYEAAQPFLVSLPSLDDGVYLYDVDASPKVEDLVESEPPADPEDSSTVDPALPQTGQLNWPIPLLAASGIVLFSIGWVLRFGKKNCYEK